MVGSPFLYYGDEIGMGDDISLFDRNGVRTPMQWDASPNAGFSDAPAEKLYAPVISDPVYGYQKVNVASQEADPYSLLNRLRHLIFTRKSMTCLVQAISPGRPSTPTTKPLSPTNANGKGNGQWS